MSRTARSSAEKVGDITFVLGAVAAATLAGGFAAAADQGAGAMWGSIASAGHSCLLAGFAAAALFGWMDEDRRPQARILLMAVLPGAVLCVIAGTIGDHRLFTLGGGAAIFSRTLSVLSSLALGVGGIALVTGFGRKEMVLAIRQRRIGSRLDDD